MMKRTIGGLTALVTVMALGASELEAQRGPQRPQGFANRGQRAGVEMIMRMRARLELTDGQIQELDAIRQESVERRSAHQAEMAELLSQLQAGEIERDAVREAVAGRREAAQEAAEQQKARIEGILTDTQRETLQEIGSRARAFGRGYVSGMRGRQPGIGGRGPLGQSVGRMGMRGGRAGGFAPRRGQGFTRGRRPVFGPGFGRRAGPLPGFRRGR